MTVEARLKTILEKFGDPVENSVYHGKADRYYTFNITTLGDDYADDEPQHERYLVQVHLYAPLSFNYIGRRKMTKIALVGGGFTWPQVTDASDSGGRHLVFETQFAEGVDSNGDYDD